MNRIDKVSNNTPVHDLMVSTAMIFIIMMIIAFVHMNPITKEAEFVRKAEYILEISWRNASNNDVDVHVKNPRGEVLYFENRQMGFLHLDKDDQGHKTDKVVDEFGIEKIVPINREVVTFRGIDPGKYIVNLHMYFMRTFSPEPVEIRLLKVNPYENILTRKIVLSERRQEKTAYSFIILPDGSYEELDTTSEYKFVYENVAHSFE